MFASEQVGRLRCVTAVDGGIEAFPFSIVICAYVAQEIARFIRDIIVVSVVVRASLTELPLVITNYISKKCVCLRPHGGSVNFYGDRNRFEV